jgi:hypothetical protein
MRKRRLVAAVFATALTSLALAAGPAFAGSGGLGPLRPTVGTAAAFDVSPALRDIPTLAPGSSQHTWRSSVPRDRSLVGRVTRAAHEPDGALQSQVAAPSAMPPPLFTFEGPRNEDNFTLLNRRVNPPDPVGDVGQHNYVAMVNLTYAVYSKSGALQFGPVPTGTLWQGFSVPDCAGASGDGIVNYDEISNRWILSQFTSQGPNEFWNCVAVSTTEDPLGSYYRYAFSTGAFFPDYPKYGIMGDGLYITTREFGPTTEYQIGIYAINRHQLVEGDPNPTVVSFYLVDGVDPLYLLGDGILPADQDGKRMPPPHSPEYLVGTQDDDYVYGAPFDAINFYKADVDFAHPDNSTFDHQTIPVAAFDSDFPCFPDARDCLPQPTITDRAQYLDILSYRQRPTYRLQYRNFKTHESLVTNQSVEARPGVAGVRWYEIRNPNGDPPTLYQQGTYAPNDGVHRWMGSVATDKFGNLAAGYSVVNGTDVFGGIRYSGRKPSDPLGELSQGEATLQDGSGVQTTTNSRWGDYTSLNVDPRDDCTFYYINEYYRESGNATDTRPWRTRIGAFRFPGC